jgi:hypothetical protein
MTSCAMFIFIAVLAAAADAASPVDKVIGLLADLVVKIQKEDEEAQKVFAKFDAWCVERNTNIEFEIKTGKAEVADLSATIQKEAALSSASRTRMEELAASIAKDDSDLKAATEVRGKEASDFASEEQETRDCISALERAVAILTREMTKGSAASMMQIKGTNNIVQALQAMVQASSLSSADATRLTSLVQNSHESESSDEDEADPAVYKKDRGGIIGVLENLLDKAQDQLEKARTSETAKRHNFALLKQSLDDEMDADKKDMAQSKKNVAASEEAKATAEGDLAVTSADLKEDEDTFATLAQDCKTGREDHAADSASRAEELHNLAFAKKLLVDENATYTAAVVHTYGDAALDQVATFFQVGSDLISSADLVKFEAVRFIRDLARKENSPALAQLATKMSSVIRFGETSGSDPMAKVKQLIAEMIATLEKDAKADATQQAFCDKEISESKTKNAENQAQLDKLSTSIDSMSAKTAKLKEDSATLQMELSQLAKAQAEMDKMRFDAKALFAKHKAEMQAGITGLQQAVSVLREYYANDDSNRAEAGHGGHAAGQSGHNEGAGRIISELQLVESDFSKTLAEMEGSEATAANEYEETSHVNEISKATKENNLKHHAKEAAGLGKSLVDAKSDKEGVQSEYDAVTEYLTKLGQMCTGKASTFSDRKSRRDAEISGLQEALAILSGKAAFIQRSSKRSFRGKQSSGAIEA